MMGKNDWFVLAQLLAILSGTWMVGAGMFMGVGSSSLALAQSSIISMSPQLQTLGSGLNITCTPQVAAFYNELNPTIKSNLELVKAASDGVQILYKSGVAFALASIVAWLWGAFGSKNFWKLWEFIKDRFNYNNQ